MFGYLLGSAAAFVCAMVALALVIRWEIDNSRPSKWEGLDGEDTVAACFAIVVATVMSWFAVAIFVVAGVALLAVRTISKIMNARES